MSTDCKFSPGIIRDVAKNILAFLKSNAAKEGHTYWLFKAKDDDVVKLYDLVRNLYMFVDRQTNRLMGVKWAQLTRWISQIHSSMDMLF